MNNDPVTLTAPFQRLKARWQLLTAAEHRLLLQFADQLVSQRAARSSDTEREERALRSAYFGKGGA